MEVLGVRFTKMLYLYFSSFVICLMCGIFLYLPHFHIISKVFSYNTVGGAVAIHYNYKHNS